MKKNKRFIFYNSVLENPMHASFYKERKIKFNELNWFDKFEILFGITFGIFIFSIPVLIIYFLWRI